MKRLKNRKFAVDLTLLAALAGFALRLLAKKTAGFLWPLCILAVLFCAAALLTAVQLRRRPSFGQNFQPSLLEALALPAAALLLAAAVIHLRTLTGLNRWMVGLGGLLSAVGMAAAAVQALRRTAPNSYFYMALTLGQIVILIPEFRLWSVDPRISDYCFALFARLCMLVAGFQLCGFTLDQGQRQPTAFFSMAGILFAAVAAADGGWANVLGQLGAVLFLLGVLWAMLTPPRRKRRPAPAPEAVPDTEGSEWSGN